MKINSEQAEAEFASLHTNNLLKTKKNTNNDKKYKCNQCEYSTNNKGHFQDRVRVHTGERPVKCEQAGYNKAFAQKVNLKTHYPVHTGEKPFKCEHKGCNKSFSQQGNLKNHVCIHSAERPFVCSFGDCKKQFKSRKALKQYGKRHTGDKKHKCSYCYRAFFQSQNLNIICIFILGKDPLSAHSEIA